MNTKTLSYSQAIKDAFVTYKNYCWIFFLHPIFFIGVSFVVFFFTFAIPVGIVASAGYAHDNVLLSFCSLPFMITMIFVLCWWITTLNIITLKLSDESTLLLENLIRPKKIKRFMCTAFLTGLGANFFSLFFFFPGFMWIGRYGFAEYYALETKLPMTDCFTASRLLTAGRTVSLTVFSLFSYLLIPVSCAPLTFLGKNIVSLFCLFIIPICVLMPIRLLVYAHLFRQFQSVKKDSSEIVTGMKPDMVS